MPVGLDQEMSHQNGEGEGMFSTVFGFYDEGDSIILLRASYNPTEYMLSLENVANLIE